MILPSDDKVTMLLCEGVRQELGGKITLNGFYPGNSFSVPLETKIATFSLALLFVVTDGEGEFSPTISVSSPSEKELMKNQPLPKGIKKRSAAMVVMAQFMPFMTDEFGEFKVELGLGDRQYRRSFQIERAAKSTS